MIRPLSVGFQLRLNPTYMLGASTRQLDTVTRRQVGMLRVCILSAVALFAAASAIIMLFGVGGP